MGFLRNLFAKTQPAAASTKGDGYRCRPDLKMRMQARHPDLKSAELEALTWLTGNPIKEASDHILGFMGDSTLVTFISRLREFDGTAANYLAAATSRTKDTTGG